MDVGRHCSQGPRLLMPHTMREARGGPRYGDKPGRGTKMVGGFGRRAVAALADPRCRPAAQPTGRPPNVVLIYADDLGYGDIGVYGATRSARRTSTGWRREGVRFTDFYVAQAVCSASRAALLTGAYPNRIGILGALIPTSTTGIAEGETTLAEVLKAPRLRHRDLRQVAPRAPAALPPDAPRLRRLLRPALLERHVAEPPGEDVPPLPLYSRDAVDHDQPRPAQLTGEYGRRAVAFIEAHRDDPSSSTSPTPCPTCRSSPPRPSAAARGGPLRRRRRGDRRLGRPGARALRRLGLERDTLVIFASDNGPWLSYGDHAGSAGPLREGKGTAFEGGVRVPFVARWPGRMPAGRSSASRP